MSRVRAREGFCTWAERGCFCTYHMAARDAGPWWLFPVRSPPFSLVAYFFFRILAPILTTTVKFIAIVRHKVSGSSFSFFSFLFLVFFLAPCSLSLISFLQNASPFSRDEWKFLGRGKWKARGQAIKQFPAARDSIYRTVIASEENPTTIKWSPTRVFYRWKKNIDLADVSRLLIQYVTSLPNRLCYYTLSKQSLTNFHN